MRLYVSIVRCAGAAVARQTQAIKRFNPRNFCVGVKEQWHLPRCPLLAQSRHELVQCTCPLSGAERTLPRNAMQTRRRTYGRRSGLISHLLGTYLLGAGRRSPQSARHNVQAPLTAASRRRPALRALEARQNIRSAPGRPVLRRPHERSGRYLPKPARPNGGRTNHAGRARLRHLLAAFKGAHHLHHWPDRRRHGLSGYRAAAVLGSRESEEGNLDVH
jgi:hypothetical protein